VGGRDGKAQRLLALWGYSINVVCCSLVKCARTIIYTETKTASASYSCLDAGADCFIEDLINFHGHI
jgi:hypothetical protein